MYGEPTFVVLGGMAPVHAGRRSAASIDCPRDSEGRLVAWTEQHPTVLERLRSGGEFHADGRRVPRSVRPVFGWMRREMIERVDGACGRSLIWLTVVPNLERDRLCDWRCTRRTGELCSKVHITPGKDWIRVSISASRALVSDFAMWSERVMAYQYVPSDEADAARWDRRLRSELHTPRGAETPHPLSGTSERTQRAVIASWQRIFDVDPHAGRTIQATVEYLSIDDVIDVVRAPAPEDVPLPYNSNVSTYRRPI